MTEALMDTMVVEKATTYLTEPKLHVRSLLRLNGVERQSGVGPCQSYSCTAKRMAAQIGRCSCPEVPAHAQGTEEAQGRLGRLVLDPERKTDSWGGVSGGKREAVAGAV